MARAIWKGAINFGLVNIPVGLYAAEKPKELKLRMLDRRNLSPIKYHRVNEKSGEEVPWDSIVKGYEYERDEFVLLSDADFKKARPEQTQSIDIVDFVDCKDIHPVYYDKPYYLVPEKKARRSYALLREAMRRSCRIGVAQVVIHTRQHLAALMVYENALVVELMRFAEELRPIEEFDLPSADLKEVNLGEKELKMAERLMEEMTGDWKPEAYHDTYTESLMNYIEKRIESGQTKRMASESEVPEPGKPADVVDMMEMLKRSLRNRGSEADEEEEDALAEGTTGRATGGRKAAPKKPAPKSAAKKAAPRKSPAGKTTSARKKSGK